MNRLLSLTLASALGAFSSIPANAADILFTGDQTIAGFRAVNGPFAFTFTYGSTVDGFINILFQNTAITAAQDIDFDQGASDVDGAAFDAVNVNEPFLEQLFKFDVPVIAGAEYIVRLAGTAGDGTSVNQPILAYSLSFHAIPVVPEPASWAMLIAGFGLIGAQARRIRVSCASA